MKDLHEGLKGDCFCLAGTAWFAILEGKHGLRAGREVHTYSRSLSARRCRPGSRRRRRSASAPGCSACCCTGTALPCTAGAAFLPL